MTDWNFGFTPLTSGWIPPVDRTTEAQKAHETFIDDTPTVGEVFSGSSATGRDRSCLFDVVDRAIAAGKLPSDYVRNGKLKDVAQLTGSCVGGGATNMALYQTIIDAIYRGQTDRIVLPCYLYHYGRGRFHSGMRGRGAGSSGSGQAKALQVDGWLPFDHPAVPKPSFKAKTIEWTANEEYTWSAGERIDPALIQEGQKQRWPTVARVSSTDEAATLADSFYGFTIASDWGGLDKCPIVEGVLLSRRATIWHHQMSVLGYMNHPTLGRIWYVLNQWLNVMSHGVCPTGAPEGGFWIKDDELAYIIRQQETFAFADPEGFKDRSSAFDWLLG